MDEPSDAETLAQRISFLEDKKARLLREVDSVESDLAVVRTQYYQVQNRKAAISKLPDELLVSIFALTQKVSPVVPFEILASQVSSHWRELALATPTLWSNIDIGVSSSNKMGHTLNLLSVYLTRSSTCPLNISLHSFNYDISNHFQLIIPHSSRWWRVSISSANLQVKDFQVTLAGVAVPLLEHFSLRIGRPVHFQTTHKAQMSAILPTIFISAPLLSFVRITGKPFAIFQPPLAAVTTLHLESWMGEYLIYSQFQRLLDELPVLANLSLALLTIHLPRDPLVASTARVIPTLRHLRVCGSETPIDRLFSFVSLPGLLSLSLLKVDSFAAIPVSTAKSLTLSKCTFAEGDLRSIIRAFPSLTDVTLDDSVPDIFGMLQPIWEVVEGLPQPGAVPWPKLRTLTLTELQPADALPLCAMVLSLKAAGCPLGTLRLSRHSRTVLRLKGNLEGLRIVVKVEHCDSDTPWPPGLGYEDLDDNWE